MTTETELMTSPGTDPKPRRFAFREGRVYFSRETERQFYFILTVIMAVAALAHRLGWLG